MYTHAHATFAFLPHFPPFFSLKHLPTPLLPSPAKPFLEDFVMKSFVNTSLVGILIESRSRLYLHFYKYHAWMCMHIAVSKWPKYMAALAHTEQQQICKEWKNNQLLVIICEETTTTKHNRWDYWKLLLPFTITLFVLCWVCVCVWEMEKNHPIPDFFPIQRFPFVSTQYQNTPNPLF